jgi:predicted RNA-binding Zn-ribbon protein involved in translation (DUF1610 family)
MKTQSDSLADASDVMREAGVQLEAVSKMMDSLEAQQREFIVAINKVLDYADKLELERNAWRFRAEELERELRDARRKNAELAVQTNEARCPECGDHSIALVRHEDGMTLDCQECGHKEEIP